METRAIYRTWSRLGAGAAWGRAEVVSRAARPLPGKAGPPGEREERRGAGGPGPFSKRDPIPIPGTSLAHQVRLGLCAYAGRGDLAPALSLGLSGGVQ